MFSKFFYTWDMEILIEDFLIFYGEFYGDTCTVVMGVAWLIYWHD